MLPAIQSGFTAPVTEPENYEPKCLCVICVDTSSSMKGSPIDQVNAGLRVFEQELKQDITTKSRVEVCIITFDSEVACIQEPALIGSSSFQSPTLAVKGSTKLVDGMRMAMDKVEERKAYYKATGQGNYYRPFIMLITDGAADRTQDVDGLSVQLQDAVQGRKFSFLPIAVGDQVPASFAQLCYPATAMRLDGLKFVELFMWLSNSMSSVAHSGSGVEATFAPIDAWSGGAFMQKSV